MIGYGAEDNHFVAELTYNYGMKSYKLGNGFLVSKIIFQVYLFTYFILLFKRS